MVFGYFVVMALSLAANKEYLVPLASLSRLGPVETHFFFGRMAQGHVEPKLKACSMEGFVAFMYFEVCLHVPFEYS